jgi:hypothetical protein
MLAYGLMQLFEIQKLPEEILILLFLIKVETVITIQLKLLMSLILMVILGFTDSYVGIQFLGSEPKLSDKIFDQSDSISTVSFVSWQFRNTDDPNFFTPQDDITKIQKCKVTLI